MAVIIRSLTLGTLPTRVQNIGVSFLLWRFKALRVTIMPFAAEGLTVPTDISVGFSSAASESGPPNTFEKVLQDMTVTSVCSFGMTQPAVMNIPARVLSRKQQPWLRVLVQTGDPPGEVSAGELIAYSRVAVTGTFCFIMDGICEFTQPSDSGFDLSRLRPTDLSQRAIPQRVSPIVEEVRPSEEKEVSASSLSGPNDSLGAPREMSSSDHRALRALLRLLERGAALPRSDSSWADDVESDIT